MHMGWCFCVLLLNPPCSVRNIKTSNLAVTAGCSQQPTATSCLLRNAPMAVLLGAPKRSWVSRFVVTATNTRCSGSIVGAIQSTRLPVHSLLRVHFCISTLLCDVLFRRNGMGEPYCTVYNRPSSSSCMLGNEDVQESLIRVTLSFGGNKTLIQKSRLFSQHASTYLTPVAIFRAFLNSPISLRRFLFRRFRRCR